MNEYEVTVTAGGHHRQLTVLAATAATARSEVEQEHDVVAVKFIRAVSFSCAIRDGERGR